MITSDYKNKVLSGFIKMREGIVGLDKKSKGYDNFVEATKIIIDWGQDMDNSFSLAFSNDYLRVQKSVIKIYESNRNNNNI